MNQAADHDQIPLAMVAALVKLRDQGLNQVAHHDQRSVSPATAYASSALAHSPASCSFQKTKKVMIYPHIDKADKEDINILFEKVLDVLARFAEQC